MNNNISDAIDDACALLEALLSNNWQDAHVVSGETEIFIARYDGRENRLCAEPALAIRSAETKRAFAKINAHVATLVDAAAVGSCIVAGQRIATIRVLDVDESVIATCSGEIVKVCALNGDLLEFGMPILEMSQSA